MVPWRTFMEIVPKEEGQIWVRWTGYDGIYRWLHPDTKQWVEEPNQINMPMFPDYHSAREAADNSPKPPTWDEFAATQKDSTPGAPSQPPTTGRISEAAKKAAMDAVYLSRDWQQATGSKREAPLILNSRRDEFIPIIQRAIDSETESLRQRVAGLEEKYRIERFNRNSCLNDLDQLRQDLSTAKSLNEELVREVERRLANVERIEPNCQCRNCVYTRQLLARAKQGEGRVQG